MSHAFVKEDDEQWLHDISPTMTALVNYLTRQNNGVRVYEIKTSFSKDGKELHHMSNGLQYYIDEKSQWNFI